MEYNSSDDEFDDSSDDGVSSLDCKVTHRQAIPSALGGPSTSGMGRAAALGMDVGLPEESVDQSQRKKTHSSALLSSAALSSALLSASNIKKNLTSLIKKKKLEMDKKKSKRKGYHKRMPSEDDIITTDAVASQASHGNSNSLVNKLGMAVDPTYIRSQSQRSLSQTEQQSPRNSSVSCPGALEMLLGCGDQTSLNSEYKSRETKNTENATMDSREIGSNQHLTDLQPTAEEAAPPQETKNTENATMDSKETGSNQHLTDMQPTAEEAAPPQETKNTENATMDSKETGSNQHLTDLQPTAEEPAPPQETSPSSITSTGDDLVQSYCLDACWPTNI
jgi:hypothetical protein